MRDKLQILYVPFLLTLFGLLVGYTFFHWLLFIRLDLFPLKQVITNVVIPMVLAGLAAWILFMPRLKVLNLNVRRGNIRPVYGLVLWVIFSIPLMIAQEYIITATGTLTALNSIREISRFEPAKYYTLKQYYIDKEKLVLHAAFDVSGKYGQRFNMHIYVALPIYEKPGDTADSSGPPAWLGLVYHKMISNRLDKNEKQEEYTRFARQSQADFGRKNVSKFVYLDRVGYSADREGWMEAVKKSPVSKPDQPILVPVDKPFAERNGDRLNWILGWLLAGSVIWLIMLLIPGVDGSQLHRIKAGKPDRKARKEMQAFLALIKPREGFFITPIIICINFLVFLAMVFAGLGFVSFSGHDLLAWGGNLRSATLNGAWWRLVTNVFLHGGILHLMANMYGLFFVGIFLEPVMGRARYLVTYLLTGVIASCASIWWHEATVSVGASGAIFGMYGLFIALILTRVFPRNFGKAFLTGTLVFVGFNLLMGLTGGIDNAAHIGGLISGFVIGLVLFPSLRKQRVIND